MIELALLKELTLIKQGHQKSVIFVATGIFQIKRLGFDSMSAMGVIIY